MQTRRSFLSASGLLAVFQPSAFPAGSWLDKNPDQWTADDLDKVLNHSEWVRQVMLTYVPSVPLNKPNRQHEGVERSSDFNCQMRWESGLPMRLARRFTLAPTVTYDESYVLSISNLPVAFLADSLGHISGRLGQNEDGVKDNITTQLRQSALLQREAKRRFTPCVPIGYVQILRAGLWLPSRLANMRSSSTTTRSLFSVRLAFFE
jgi:hypothetical protein